MKRVALLVIPLVVAAAPWGVHAADTAPPPAQRSPGMVEFPVLDVSVRPPAPLPAESKFVLQERLDRRQAASLPIGLVRASVLEGQLEVQLEQITPAVLAESVQEEEARFNAVFGASLSRSKTEDFAGGSTRGQAVTVGTTFPLRSGGSLTIGMPINVQQSPQKLAVASPSLTFTQPLARNAGVRINTSGLLRARIALDQGLAKAKLAVMNYLSHADQTYWRHWAAWQEVEIRHEQYELAKRQVGYAEETVKAGLIARVDIIRSESGVARRIEAIVLAENYRRQTERELKRIMNRPGWDLEGDAVLQPVSEPELVEWFPAPDKVLALAETNRMDLLDAQYRVAIAALDDEVARNQLLPLLSFSLGYTSKNWSSQTSDAIGGVFDRKYPDWNVGLMLEIPFDNSAAIARRKKAALQQAASIETLAARRRSIRKEVLDTIDQLRQSWQRILAARQEIGTANQIYEAELEQFRHGMRTSTDVLNAAQLIADAKIRNVSAVLDLELSKVNIAYATGTTLGFAGFELAPRR
jgi:outer membrane protein TolC